MVGNVHFSKADKAETVRLSKVNFSRQESSSNFLGSYILLAPFRICFVILALQLIKPVIFPLLRHQFVMRAFLHNLPAL